MTNSQEKLTMVSATMEYNLPKKISSEIEEAIIKENSSQELPPVKLQEQNIIWKNVIYLCLMHVFAIWGVTLLPSMRLATVIYGYLLYQAGSIGTMAGTHRLWSHRSYKAKWPLRLILIIFTTIAYQTSTFEWARNHRLHHKFSDTDLDPYNSNRGFFFSHIGWVLMNKRPEVIKKGKEIDVSDMLDDPFVRFQHQNYWILPLGSYVIPVLIPIFFWQETFFNAFCMNWLRYLVCLHGASSINSFAHMYGYRPYDSKMEPRQNLFVSIVASGEGWHNYHHSFPWDYRASEFGNWNLAYRFIKFFSKIGWAYDLKTASDDIIKQRMQRTGELKNER